MLLSDGEEWHVHPEDVIPHMLAEMPPASVDMTVTSVPFPQMFAYTEKECDLGNSEDMGREGKIHFSFFFRGLRRVLKPGRVAMIHCMQIPRAKRSGGQGLIDFRGLLIRLGQRADWSTTMTGTSAPPRRPKPSVRANGNSSFKGWRRTGRRVAGRWGITSSSSALLARMRSASIPPVT